MKPLSPRIKEVLFTLLWVIQAASCFGIGGFSELPLVLAGFIVVLLLLLWLFPKSVVLKRYIFGGFILLSISFLFMAITWALFFGKNYPLQCVLFAVGLCVLFASCWLIKPKSAL